MRAQALVGLLVWTVAAACSGARSEAGVSAAAAPLKEVDLSAWGKQWKGYVAMAPASAKVTFDDPSRQLHLSDEDYINVSEAPFFQDGIAGLSKDADNKNIVKVSATEVTYERNPPLGKQWCFDSLVKTGKAKWSCAAQSFTSAETAKRLLEICRSIKKR
jgi:hypothetical protein